MCGCGRTSALFESPGRKINRPDVVEEHERPDHPLPCGRKHPADLQVPEAPAPLLDDLQQHHFDGVYQIGDDQARSWMETAR